jgi:hypothetical protein
VGKLPSILSVKQPAQPGGHRRRVERILIGGKVWR